MRQYLSTHNEQIIAIKDTAGMKKMEYVSFFFSIVTQSHMELFIIIVKSSF